MDAHEFFATWRISSVVRPTIGGFSKKSLSRSPSFHSAFPADGIEGSRNHKIDDHNVRLAAFAENALTLGVGDDLKDIHQVGRDIFFCRARRDSQFCSLF
ncbi:MAG: hypothetical protein ABI674_05210 [Spartobacteria bacterium]